MDKEKDIHGGHRERMLNKLLQNSELFSEHELLEVMLYYALPRKDTNGTAHKILQYFGSLQNVFSATEKQLLAVDGVGKKVASLILVMGEIFKRLNKTKKDPVIIHNFLSAKNLLVDFFKGLNYEKFLMILLDKKYKVLSMVEFSDENNRSVSAEIPELTMAFNIHRPTYAIMSHNHTSGNILPSKMDDFTTKKINVLCELHDITLTDHIIVSGNLCFSYEREGKLDEIKKTSSLDKLFEKIENY